MLSFCGIDVSKDRLDVIVLPEEQCWAAGLRTGDQFVMLWVLMLGVALAAYLRDILQHMTEGRPMSRLDELLPSNWSNMRVKH